MNDGEKNKNDIQNINEQNNSNITETKDKFITDDNIYDKYKVELLKVSNDFADYDITFKIIIIGNSGVGKTCITNQALKERFSEQYQSTIGMEIYSLFFKINNKVIKLQIWDTCGQELYRSLITNFYRTSSLAIMVYSIEDRDSFKDLDLWLKELRLYNSPDTKLILIGNKLDLDKDRKVLYEEGENFTKTYGLIDFFETSAKTGINIRKMFIKVAIILYEEHMKYKNEEEYSGCLTNSIPNTTEKLKRTKKKKKGCC